MACISPLTGYRASTVNENGRRPLVFKARDGFYDMPVTVSCGQCIRCRLRRAGEWAARCMHEASLYDDNIFVTLTYDDAHLPPDGSLNHEHFQLFIKKLRKHSVAKRGRSFKFLMSGEYGAITDRPHYHAILFDFDFMDKRYFRTTPKGHKIFKSETLDKIWGNGLTEYGSVTHDSAAYVAKYCVKKLTGEQGDARYNYSDLDGNLVCRRPEYGMRSNGLGKSWIKRFKSDVLVGDTVFAKDGRQIKPPRYYDKVLKEEFSSEFEILHRRRMAGIRGRVSDNGWNRYRSAEAITLAQLNQRPKGSL